MKQEASVKVFTSRVRVTPRSTRVKLNNVELRLIAGAQELSGIQLVTPISKSRELL